MDRRKLYLSTIDPKAQDTARKYGLGLEIAEYCTALNMDQGFPQMDALVREKLNGIHRRLFHGPFNELFPCAIDPKARELAAFRYRQAIDLAVGYGADKIVLHGGFNPYLYFPQWYVAQSIPFWKQFLEDIPEGITICLENVLEPEPELLRDIVWEVNDPHLRLCLDVGHGNAYSKTPLSRWLEHLAPYLSHFHIHNNDGTWDTHSPLDQGTIPIRDFLARAEALCPEATFTLELTEAEPSVNWLLEA